MYLKKQICLLIAVILLISNSGLAFNVHFCEGKIAAVSSVFSKEEICNTSDSELAKQMPIKEEKYCCVKPDPQHKKCCSDKEVNLKNKTEKIVLKTFSSELNSYCFFSNWDFKIRTLVTFISSPTTHEYYCDANAPPLYKLYCQFTLFG